MDRRRFIGTAASGLLAAPLAAQAQQAAKVPRIGFLAGNVAVGPLMVDGFRQGMRDLGYLGSGAIVGLMLIAACADAETGSLQAAEQH